MSRSTLEGKKAGLQDAKALREETRKFKDREKRHFEQMSDEISGRGAKAVQRDKRTGKRRDLEREEREKEEQRAVEEKRLDKYKKLGRGLVQGAQQAQRIQEHLHEMSKPLARYADDEDLEKLLKNQEREGDPMLKFIKAKQNAPDIKRYKGPAPPPNRFNILPGHKWDGVDRSNGFEKKLFEQMNAKKAVEEEAYKWSVSDM